MASPYSERLGEDRETELTRLSSDKLLLAATGASLEPGTVLAAVYRAVVSARDAAVLDGETDHPAADCLEPAEETLAGVAERLAGAADVDDHEGPTIFQAGDPAGPLERAGAVLVAAPAILDGCCLQAVSFFVNEADDASADLCRDLRADVGELGESGTACLDDAVETEDDASAVDAGARAAVDASYRRYADTLEDMGLDPKPVC